MFSINTLPAAVTVEATCELMVVRFAVFMFKYTDQGIIHLYHCSSGKLLNEFISNHMRVHGPCLGEGQGDLSPSCFWGWGTKKIYTTNKAFGNL